MQKLANLQSTTSTCGKLGNKSAAVASASDPAVSVLSISGGKYMSIARLSGHPTLVESISWDTHSEETLVAGCAGGSVWLWDVGTETPQTTFSGHRSSCTASAYHPFGHFFATGSSDTNIKVWDVRTGKCIQTYRSHVTSVSSLSFSPHGRWLTSGDEDGTIRVFDLSSGKELSCLESHTASITCIDFHPTDFFFISSALDRTIKLWSCDGSFSLAASSEPEDTAVRVLKFNQQGNTLSVASDAGVKRFQLDNEEKRISCLSSDTNVAWSSVLDMTVGEQDTIAVMASSPEGAVSLWSSREPAEVSRKENKRLPNRVSPTISTPTGIKAVLSRRLLSARTISSMWVSGNPKAAVDEAAASEDPIVFISLLLAIANEKSKVAFSLEVGLKILSHVVDSGFLSLPYTPSVRLVESFNALPFSNPLAVSSSLDDATCQGQSDLTFIVGTVISATGLLAKRMTKSERVDRTQQCFQDIADILRTDLRSTKVLKREKDDLLTEIVALIHG